MWSSNFKCLKDWLIIKLLAHLEALAVCSQAHISTDDKSILNMAQSFPNDTAVIGMDAMRRSNSTLEDFVRDTVVHHGNWSFLMQAIFSYIFTFAALPNDYPLLFVEALIWESCTQSLPKKTPLPHTTKHLVFSLLCLVYVLSKKTSLFLLVVLGIWFRPYFYQKQRIIGVVDGSLFTLNSAGHILCFTIWKLKNLNRFSDICPCFHSQKVIFIRLSVF